MPEVKVKVVPYEAVSAWRSLAAREHVALGPTSNTTWYGAFRGSDLVGVAGLIVVSKTRARIKGVFVPRDLRGQGIGTQLTERILELAPKALDVEVLAYNPAFYQGKGFDLEGQYRPGVSRLVYARQRA
jgi:GNAT superfamily N-acetyltransferase